MIDHKIIDSFISKGIYSTKEEVLHEALKSLVRDQMRREAEANMLKEWANTLEINVVACKSCNELYDPEEVPFMEGCCINCLQLYGNDYIIRMLTK